MSEIIEFAKILRRKAASHLDDGVKPADIAAAIAEYESTRGATVGNETYLVDREAAAQRAWRSFFSTARTEWRQVLPNAKDAWRRVVDAVLDVPSKPQGFATDNARPDHADNLVNTDAPSPSLDEARKRWEETCPPVPDSAYDYIAALEQALRGIQRTMLAVLYMAAVACAWTLIVLVIVATTGCAP